MQEMISIPKSEHLLQLIWSGDIIDGLTAKTSLLQTSQIATSEALDVLYLMMVSQDWVTLLTEGTNQVLNWTWYKHLDLFQKLSMMFHDLNVLVGTEAIQNNFKQFGATRIQFLLEDVDFMVLNAGPPDGQNTNGFRSESTLFSQFGKIDYAYAGKYLLSATLRRDGSSVFGPNNRYAVFPAFSAGWRISDEDFFNSSFINELKLRGGWGRTGNQKH